MTDVLTYKSMLTLMTNTIPSAILVINPAGRIEEINISRYSGQKLKYLTGKDFFKLLKRVLGVQTADIIFASYLRALDSKEHTELIKLKHMNARGLYEYFNVSFSCTAQAVIALFHKVTEEVLIEEEFTCMAEQYETVNRELCASVSSLDFHLMDIDQAHKKIAALFKITSIVQKTVNEQEVLEEILDGITRELGYSGVAILLLDDDNVLRLRAARGSQGNSSDRHIPLGQGIAGYAALHRELVYVDDLHPGDRCIAAQSSRGINAVRKVAVPLIVDDKVLGVLDIEVNKEKVIQPYELDLLRSISSQVGMTIAHAQHVANVEQQAITDDMTRLYNYRYFRTLLEQEIKRAARYTRPLSMFMIDIDFFKTYNDNNGHLLGDKVLALVAKLIKGACRDTDHVFRYGGEEFSVLLPETTIRQAYEIAERIRQEIGGYHFPNSQEQPFGALTVSIGVAAYPVSADGELELIDCADAALYLAKKTRNAACIFPQEPAAGNTG